MERKLVFWEVDVQVDFMLPGGKLYVPGAEKIIPRIERLVECARTTGTMLVSSCCAHPVDDPEFQQFPPHCIRGTPGAEIIPQGMLGGFRVVRNDGEALPTDLLDAPQIVIEKQMLDVFSNPHAGEIVEKLGPDVEYAVFGVVTEHCVQFAASGLLARGRRVALVTDALETLDGAVSRQAIGELCAQGARQVTTAQIVARAAGAKNT